MNEREWRFITFQDQCSSCIVARCISRDGDWEKEHGAWVHSLGDYNDNDNARCFIYIYFFFLFFPHCQLKELFALSLSAWLFLLHSGRGQQPMDAQNAAISLFFFFIIFVLLLFLLLCVLCLLYGNSSSAHHWYDCDNDWWSSDRRRHMPYFVHLLHLLAISGNGCAIRIAKTDATKTWIEQKNVYKFRIFAEDGDNSAWWK